MIKYSTSKVKMLDWFTKIFWKPANKGIILFTVYQNRKIAISPLCENERLLLSDIQNGSVVNTCHSSNSNRSSVPVALANKSAHTNLMQEFSGRSHLCLPLVGTKLLTFSPLREVTSPFRYCCHAASFFSTSMA